MTSRSQHCPGTGSEQTSPVSAPSFTWEQVSSQQSQHHCHLLPAPESRNPHGFTHRFTHQSPGLHLILTVSPHPQYSPPSRLRTGIRHHFHLLLEALQGLRLDRLASLSNECVNEAGSAHGDQILHW